MSENKYKALFDKAKLDSSVKERVKEKVFAMTFKVEVGDTEKHIIEFVFDRFWGYVLIKVDGQLYKRKVMLWIKKAQSFEIEIGNVEKHVVRITLIRAAAPTGARECTAWVYVDNKLVEYFDRSLRLGRKRYRDMSQRGKTAMILSVLLIIAIITFSIVYNLPISIDENFNGVIIRAGSSEPDYLQPINIDIEGEYRRNLLFRSPYSFDGKVRITDKKQDTDMVLSQQDQVSRINIGVPVIADYLEAIRSFGHSFDDGIFYMKPDASAFMIIVFEREANGEPGGAGGKDGVYYVGPCETREEALDIVNELFQLTRGKKAGQIE